MVTIEQRVRRLLRYRTFWFPSCAQAAEISESLRPDDVVRFFAVSPALQGPPHLVEHYKFDTLWINLSSGPEAVLNGMKRKSCRYEIRRAEKMLNRVAIEVGSEKANRDFLKVYSRNKRQSTSGISRAVSSVCTLNPYLHWHENAALLRTGVPDLRLWRPRAPGIHLSFQVIVWRCCPASTLVSVERHAMGREARQAC
jgi:hypothetical protein